MGAGAGYKINVEDCELTSMAEIVPQDIVSLDRDGGYCSVMVKCDIKLNATLTGGSYYDSIGNIKEVALTVTEVKLSLDFGSGINAEILTADATEKFENQFDTDIESLWKELIDVVEIEDLDMNYIKDKLDYGKYYEGSASLGGGWIGSTFDGEFEVTDVNSSSGYNDIESYTAFIPDDDVIDFIDKAKYGDNVEYTAFYNGDILDAYNELDEAITALKEEILEDVAAADLTECYVERSYYYLRNASVDNYEYEHDWDYSEVEYSADSDPEFEEFEI